MGKVKIKEEPSAEEKEPRRLINDIRNKTFRRKIVHEERSVKRKAKKKERKRRQEKGEKGQTPHTLESLRIPDETALNPQDEDDQERIEEVHIDTQTDLFQGYFNLEYEPKVLITFSDNPMKKTRVFGIELSRVIPNSLPRLRNKSSIKKMVKRAAERKFSDIIIINDDRGTPNGLTVVHLPNGPTAYFRMSNVKLTSDLKLSHKEISEHRPEVVVSNFTTHLGSNVARMLASLFHYNPQFTGRRVVTFHNQRDYIFFRHHRYEFKKNAVPKLKELGPRFTLRLEYMQEGTFDTKLGEFLWTKVNRRHQLESNRRRFHL